MLEVVAPSNGILTKIMKAEGDVVQSAEKIGEFSDETVDTDKAELIEDSSNEVAVETQPILEKVSEIKADKKIAPAAKKIIKEVVNVFDHKFFINKKYLKSEDDSHYQIQFEGPKGMFDLQVPKNTTYLLEGEATVESLSSEIIKLLAPKMPSNVEAVGVYIYEGYNKGSHIISNISR